MNIMDIIGRIFCAYMVIMKIALGILAVFGPLWLIHPLLACGFGFIITYMWFDKKNSIRY